jgi:hypothetical protein
MAHLDAKQDQEEQERCQVRPEQAAGVLKSWDRGSLSQPNRSTYTSIKECSSILKCLRGGGSPTGVRGPHSSHQCGRPLRSGAACLPCAIGPKLTRRPAAQEEEQQRRGVA